MDPVTIGLVVSAGVSLLSGIFSASAEEEAARKEAAARRAQGKAQQEADYLAAAQMEQNAGQDQAAGQRNAANAQRQSELIQSRALAVAGASGAGMSDPSIVKIMGDLAKEGQLAVDTQLYQGDEAARQGRFAAKVKRYEGDQARKGLNIAANSAIAAGNARATATLLGTASTALKDYSTIKSHAPAPAKK